VEEIKMRIIDADGHVLERDIPWADLIDAPYRSRAPRPVQDNRGYTFIMIDGKLTPKPVGKACSFVGAPRSHSPQPTTGMVDPKQRLKDMDLEGIDTAVLFGTSPFLSLPFVEDKDLASAVARVYNNWLAGYCSADPRRLKGVAAVAIQDPTEAVKELRRAVDELKFVAVAAPPISASIMRIVGLLEDSISPHQYQKPAISLKGLQKFTANPLRSFDSLAWAD